MNRVQIESHPSSGGTVSDNTSIELDPRITGTNDATPKEIRGAQRFLKQIDKVELEKSGLKIKIVPHRIVFMGMGYLQLNFDVEVISPQKKLPGMHPCIQMKLRKPNRFWFWLFRKDVISEAFSGARSVLNEYG